MVRMGSPVRFRRGAPHQTTRSGGVRPRFVLCLEGRQLPFARDLPVRFAHCESMRAGSWDQVTVPARCSAASSTHSTLRTMRGGDHVSNSRRSSLGQRPGRVQTMLASRPAIASIHRLPARPGSAGATAGAASPGRPSTSQVGCRRDRPRYLRRRPCGRRRPAPDPCGVARGARAQPDACRPAAHAGAS